MSRGMITGVIACLLAGACNAEPDRPGAEEPRGTITGHAEPLTLASWRAAADKADRVAVGRVTHVAGRRATTEQGFEVIASDVTLATEGASAGSIVFSVLGGELNGIRLDVSHTPRFDRGSRYLVLLARRPGGVFEVTGGEVGGLVVDDKDQVPALDTAVVELTASVRSVR